MAEGKKMEGGGSSNVVGITCPLVGIGLTDLPKIGGVKGSGIHGTPGSATPG